MNSFTFAFVAPGSIGLRNDDLGQRGHGLVLRGRQHLGVEHRCGRSGLMVVRRVLLGR